jgi:hypothetical protein
MCRVGQDNLPFWPTWRKIAHNYLSSTGILNQLFVHVHGTFVMLVLKKLFRQTKMHYK